LPNATVDGADVSEQSLADSRRRSPAADLFLLDLSDASFEESYRERLGRYDLVTCSEVIEHIPDDARAVGHLRALLAPGGVAIVTVPGGKMSRFDEIIGHQRHYSPERLAHLLEGQELAVESVLAWGFPFHSIYRTAVRIASRATMPKSDAPEPEANGKRGKLGDLLGQAYGLFGRGLTPLFYLNLSRWGEQMLAVARRKPS
jgi:SAM-dependent methyltransferase